MDAILYELRDHSCALNAGRWDYIFSCIKKTGALLPDRAQVTMTVPFMRSYTQLLVKTCHHRGAHAIGGMAAFIPVTARPGGERDRAREGRRGQAARGRRRLRRHVGRPSRISSPVARDEFDAVLGDRPNQLERSRDDVEVSEDQLLDFDGPRRRDHRRGTAPQRQRRCPLRGRLAAGRRRGGDRQPDGGRGDGRDLARADLVVGAVRAASTRRAFDDEIAAVEASDEAKEVFADVALSTPFKDFLTTSAYGRLP